MYKCDLCKDRIKKGQEPACVVACKERLGEKAVFTFGLREQIYDMALKRAKNEGLYIYGDRQNGGTSTLYLSKIPFERINNALKAHNERFQMPLKVENKIESTFNPIGKVALLSGALSMVGAIVGAIKSKKNPQKEENNEK